MAGEDIHIIAEAGTNHNGSVETALKLIDLANEAHADSVKFQIINTEGLYLPGKYEFGNYDIEEVRKTREKSKLGDDEYVRLDKHCKELGIPFTASVFDEEGLDLLTSFAPPYIKVASTDLNNIHLLRQIAERGIQMVISTGMSTLDEIEFTLNSIAKTGFDDIVLMHCVSAYPASLDQMNLRFLDVLKTNFGYPIGLSDHTPNSLASCIAVGMGATWFEKHYTLDRTQEGFDHAYALEADEFIQYVQDIRDTVSALKASGEKVKEKEATVRKRARRSIYAARDLAVGETLTIDDVLIVRPENVLNANQIDNVVNKKLKMALTKYQPLTLDHLGEI